MIAQRAPDLVPDPQANSGLPFLLGLRINRIAWVETFADEITAVVCGMKWVRAADRTKVRQFFSIHPRQLHPLTYEIVDFVRVWSEASILRPSSDKNKYVPRRHCALGPIAQDV